MKVTRILTKQAIPGMIVAENIYTKDHKLIIAKDTMLTDKIITRLEFYSISELSVFEAAEHDAYFVRTTYYDEIRNSEAFKRFHQAYKNSIGGFKNTFDSIVAQEKDVETDKLLSDVNNILVQCNTYIELFDMLHCMRHYDDTTYIHSLNVALICNIIGKWLGYNQKDLEVLTLCGLLHDLGKLMIPADIILKPARLTDDEFATIKTHTLRGYNLLKDKDIDVRIKNAALMHHERCDGSGYPSGFKADKIDNFAKLVSIADVYDAMTCARVYRGPLCPFEVINIFETEGYTKYDTKYIMTFLEGIVDTYIHNHVRLNNKLEGEIVFINKSELSRPIIKIGNSFINLLKNRDLFIEAII